MFRNITAIITTLLFCSNLLHAQVWIEVGGKGLWGVTMLANGNIFNDNNYTYKLKTGLGLGGRIGVNFGENHGISLEALSARGKQEWSYIYGDSATSKFLNRVEWKSIDIYTLYRYYSERAYVELGPAFSVVNSVKQIDNRTQASVIEAKDYYTKSLTSAVFGFGGFIAGSDVFSLNLGFRLSYTFTDFVADAGKSVSYPNPSRSNIDVYSTYKKTNPLAVQVGLELNFGIGEFARANCGKRGFIFSFDQDY